MPTKQDEIRVAPTDSEHNPVVVVNGKEVVVSSATEKPKRSLWVAWMYMFDVSDQTHINWKSFDIQTVVPVTLLARREEACAQVRLHSTDALLLVLLHQMA